MSNAAELHVAERSQREQRHPAVVLLLVSAGGVAGALGRYGLGELVPASHWPWSTWFVNVSGCLLLGIVTALLTHRWPRQRLLRPFLVVGVLGGYTTFSTATIEVRQLVQHGSPGLGMLYLAGTMLTALFAVAVGSMATTAVLARPEPERRGAEQGLRQ